MEEKEDRQKSVVEIEEGRALQWFGHEMGIEERKPTLIIEAWEEPEEEDHKWVDYTLFLQLPHASLP